MAIIETNENQSLDLLKTHYFNCSYNSLKNAYLDILEKMGHHIISVNDDYCEIFSEIGKMEITAKLIMQNPLSTSIDFTISSFYILSSVSKAHKFIQRTLDELEAKIQLKGISLYKGQE